MGFTDTVYSICEVKDQLCSVAVCLGGCQQLNSVMQRFEQLASAVECIHDHV